MVVEAALAGKALTLLEVIAGRGECSVADLAEGSGLPFSTTHRIMQTLLDRSYILSLGRGRYALGPAVLRLVMAAPLRKLLADIARPLLTTLTRKDHVHAHLGILDAEMVTYLVRCAYGLHPIASVEGAQLEPYCSAIGKVLLAYKAEGELNAYLKDDDFVALTPKTITTAAGLAAELCKVRQRGWAVDNEEIVMGLRCVAVPVFDAAGCVCAAISASAPVTRLPEGAEDPIRQKLCAIADQIKARIFCGGAAGDSMPAV